MKCSDWIPLAKLAKLLPGEPHLSTMHRWRLHGIRGVLLKTYLCGGRRYSTLADAEEFFASVTAAADGVKAPFRTERQRRAAIRRAEMVLQRAGIK